MKTTPWDSSGRDCIGRIIGISAKRGIRSGKLLTAALGQPLYQGHSTGADTDFRATSGCFIPPRYHPLCLRRVRLKTDARLVKHAIARYLLAEILIGSQGSSGYIFYC